MRCFVELFYLICFLMILVGLFDCFDAFVQRNEPIGHNAHLQCGQDAVRLVVLFALFQIQMRQELSSAWSQFVVALYAQIDKVAEFIAEIASLDRGVQAWIFARIYLINESNLINKLSSI